MVKTVIFFLLLPFLVWGAEFTAQVNKTSIKLNDSLILTLTLTDASTKSSPNLDVLKKYFTINSQQQASKIIMNNGKFSSNASRKFGLTPKNEGSTHIPEIKINTSEGMLSTQAIKLDILKSNAKVQIKKSEFDGITFTTHLSHAAPYVNQPLVYTLKLTTNKELANLQIQKIEIDNAIIQHNGEPKILKAMQHGAPVNIVEFSYLITFLKDGITKIPAAVIQGGMAVRANLSSGFGDDDELDSFAMLSPFYQLKPFTMASEEIDLKVLPIVTGIDPWIPAKSLTIEEIWDHSADIKVGEFFSRGIKIIAEGITSSQLAAINELMLNSEDIKVYVDKPEITDEIVDNNIKTKRVEQYTLIPQKAGSIVLPEISITWWNTSRNEKVTSTIPSRSLQVKEAFIASAPPILNQKEESPQTIEVPYEGHINNWTTAVITGLMVLILGGMGWVIILKRKINALNHPKRNEPTMNKAIHPIDIVEDEVIIKPKKNDQLPDLNPT